MSQTDEILQIDTPENVAFGYEVAGIGSRFLAALIDTIIIVAVQFVLLLVLLFIASASSPGSFDMDDMENLGLAVVIVVLLGSLITIGYYIFFELLWNGQSPGKRAVKIRVIRTDGTPVTLSEILIRNLLRLVDLLPSSYGVGVITMFVTKQSQRLGDLAAGTLVVFAETEVTIDSLQRRPFILAGPRRADAPADAVAPGSALRLERLTDQDLRLVEEFLRRRYELSNARAMATQLVSMLRKRMELPAQPEPNITPERWLADVYDAYRRRLDEK